MAGYPFRMTGSSQGMPDSLRCLDFDQVCHGAPRPRAPPTVIAGDYVSTNPVLDPLAAESYLALPHGRKDSELISISRDAVRLNSLASTPSVARYSDTGSASAEAISFTALS